MNRLLALLFHQGVLDEQFLQLQQLQDDSSPNFVFDVLNTYFQESEKILTALLNLLRDEESLDYGKIVIYLNQLMGSSSSIGAKRVKALCLDFRSACETNDRNRCLFCLQQLEEAFFYLKNKLLEFFHIEQQRVLAAGARNPARN